jgi:cell division ATPase FtsA
MCSEYDKSVASSEIGGRQLRLVKEVSEKKASQLTESNAKELRELIEEVQRKTPRKKNEDGDLLPPAA